MISMAAFVASGGMETLRYHATAVNIGDVQTDEADHHTFFVDFRFRFISEQARTFFIKQYFGMSVVETGPDTARCIYPTPIYPRPNKLVSLISDDTRLKRDDVTFRTVASKPLEKPTSQMKPENSHMVDSFRDVQVPKSYSEQNRGSLHGESNNLAREKVVFLPDTMWIDRKEALSKILRPNTNTTEPFISNERNKADTVSDQRRHTAGPSYLSDSKSHSSGQTSCDLSDDEFAFVGPRQKRASSLMETQNSVELTRNYWTKNRLAQERSSQEENGEGFMF